MSLNNAVCEVWRNGIRGGLDAKLLSMSGMFPHPLLARVPTGNGRVTDKRRAGSSPAISTGVMSSWRGTDLVRFQR